MTTDFLVEFFKKQFPTHTFRAQDNDVKEAVVIDEQRELSFARGILADKFQANTEWLNSLIISVGDGFVDVETPQKSAATYSTEMKKDLDVAQTIEVSQPVVADTEEDKPSEDTSPSTTVVEKEV